MVEYKNATIEDLIEDAKENDRVDYLKELATKKVKGKKITYLALKRKYYEKFYKSMVPVAKGKSKTFWEKIEEL